MRPKLLLIPILLLVPGVPCSGFLSARPPETQADFGDAPDPTFPSMLASDGARALDASQFWLGASADVEDDARTVDLDAFDDGLVEVLVENVIHVTFEVTMGDSAEGGRVYFNLLADANGDGQWKAVQSDGGSVAEWVVVNQALDLAPGERRRVEAEFRPVGGTLEIWLRASLSDTQVKSDDWDGTGEFARGEVEDHLIQPSPWGIECEPEPLVLEHGGSDFLTLVVTDAPIPDTLEVVSVTGPADGVLGGDPDADQIFEDPTRGTGPDVFGAGNILVGSWAVHGFPDLPIGMTYQLEVKVEGDAGVKSVNCTVVVNHIIPTPAPPPIEFAPGGSIYFGGPHQALAGGILPVAFVVEEADGQPATGEFRVTLGDPPTDPRASHAVGMLKDGRIVLEVPVTWPPGTTKLYCAFRGAVLEVGEITVLPPAG